MIAKTRLTQLREGQDLTKAALSRRARISPSDLGKIEAGRLKPYPGQLRRLARALRYEADPHELLDAFVEEGGA